MDLAKPGLFRRPRSRVIKVAALLLTLSCPVPGFADPRSKTASPGPFTQDQASKGELVFNDYCAECHRPDLTGALGPSLVNDAFKAQWSGKPVSDLRDWIRANMPPNAPGTLPDEQLDPILARILQRNGIAPGEKPLDAQSAGAPFGR